MTSLRAGYAVLLLACLASTQPLAAQPYPERPESRGSTQMPVSLPASPEVIKLEQPEALSPARVSLEQPVDPETYVCGSGDTFELNFWGQQNFRLRLTVDLEGRTFISKVGFVAVANKTLAAVRTLVKQRVRATYPGLQFDLTLVAPRTFLVHVVENVQQPGVYSTTPLERLSSLLSRAGGIAGSRRRVSIRHTNGATQTADLLLYELSGDVTQNPYLLDGDVISIPPAETVVQISGAVRRPGSYELVKTKNLRELLELAGGFTSAAVRSLPVRVIRHNARQEQVSEAIQFAAVPSYTAPLADGDMVIVSGEEALQRTVLLIGAVVGADPLDSATTAKRVPFVEGDTVMSLIDRAGGIKAPGDLRRSYIARPTPNGSQLIPIDLEALVVKRDFKADKRIAINDTVVIPPITYAVRVEGAVVRSGFYNYNPKFTIPEYIAHAGGRTRTAQDLDEAKLIDSSGATHDYKPGMRPSPGDAILVPERHFSRSEVVQIALAGAGLLLSGIAVTLAVTR